MSQMLRIFCKDVRHHWLEILVSIILLLVYAWTEPRHWAAPQFNPGEMPREFLIGILRFLLPVSWIFLALRIVHDESLVGDRQFWVTRPYDWRQLLVSKLLFFIICINLPLFVAQVFLLKFAGFPLGPNFLGLLKMQFGLFTLLVVTMLVAAITRTLAQAILVIIACLIAAAALTSLLSLVPNFDANYVNRVGDALTEWLLILAIIAVILSQYARRRTRQSIGLLIGVVIIILIINITSPYATLMNKAYPLADPAHPSPAQLALKPPTSAKPGTASAHSLPNVTLLIALRVSEAAQDAAVRIDNARLSIDGPNGAHWDSHWKRQWQTLWPEDDSAKSFFTLKKTVFDKLKTAPATVHLSLALTLYRGSATHQVIVRDGLFVIPEVGICKLAESPNPLIYCLFAIYYPSYMADFPASQSTCVANDSTNLSTQITGRTLNFSDRGVAGMISPVGVTSIGFGELPRPLPSRQPENHLHLCPGTPIQVGIPAVSGHTRIELAITRVNLTDYLQPQPGYSMYGGTTWDIRGAWAGP